MSRNVGNVPFGKSAQWRLKSAYASAQSDQNLCCTHEETWHLCLSKMRLVKILIRLRECAVWSESSLGAHIRRYVFDVAVRMILISNVHRQSTYIIYFLVFKWSLYTFYKWISWNKATPFQPRHVKNVLGAVNKDTVKSGPRLMGFLVILPYIFSVVVTIKKFFGLKQKILHIIVIHVFNLQNLQFL